MPEKLILLVEDNQDDAELALRALRKNNVAARVEVFSDGEQVLDYLFQVGRHAEDSGAVMPELILLDLKLPKLNGIEVLEKMRSSHAGRLIPVVVLTTSKDDGDILESYRHGANSYIRKPVDFSEFIAAVGEIARYWLGLNESAPATHDSI